MTSRTTDAAFAFRVLDVLARADMHDSLWWRTDGGYAPATFWIMCNDVFAWGCADAEPLTPDSLPDLEQALRDEAAVTGNNIYGDDLYCARRRGRRPQGAAYPNDRRLWPLFDACGPERPTGLGNPYPPGERITVSTTGPDPAAAVALWRCTTCGKWSHAKRQPKAHKRWVQSGSVTIADREPDTGAWFDVDVPDGDYQPCGPFAAWTAHPVEQPAVS